MNCVGFEMSINLCPVRSSGQWPSCTNALGFRAALPGRRQPGLGWQPLPEEGWQVGQAPRLNFCFLLAVNSWLVNSDGTVPAVARLSSGYLCATFSALQFLLSQEESPFPPVGITEIHMCGTEGGGRTWVPAEGWCLSRHQALALTCSW